MGSSEKGSRKVFTARELADRYESMASGYAGEARLSYALGCQTKANTLRRLLRDDPEAAEKMAAELQKPQDETRDAVRRTVQ